MPPSLDYSGLSMLDMIRSSRCRSGALALLVAASGTMIPAASTSLDAARRAFASGDLDGATAACNSLLSAAPDDVEVLLFLGQVRSRAADPDGAIAAYERLLTIEPGHKIARNNLGNTFFRRTEFARAAEQYERALETDGDYVRARLNLGRTQLELGRTDAAEESFLLCMSAPVTASGDAVAQLDCRYYQGTLRFRAEEYETAARIMEQVLAQWPEHTEARYYLGQAYLRTGRTEEGRQQLELHREILRSLRPATPIEKAESP